MVDFKYIIRPFLWLAFSFFQVNRVHLWVFCPFAPKFPFSCASVCTHCRGISRGPQSPSSCFRLESHIQRQLYFTDWQFSIIKLHEYEDSCRIPTMPCGEDLHQNSFSVHCDLLECLSGSSAIWRLLPWSASHIFVHFWAFAEAVWEVHLSRGLDQKTEKVRVFIDPERVQK